MTRSNEAGERAQEPGQVPAPAAPPSFGKAEAPRPEREPAPEPEREPAPEPGLGPGPEPEPGARISESLPVEIRLPISLQKPWWADDDSETPEPAEPAAQAGPEPAPEPTPPPGALVAGEGAPKVDTRHAVPSKPPAPPGPPPGSDTDPDGIPVVVELESTAPAAEREAQEKPGGEVLSPDAFLPPGMTPPQDSSPTPTAPIPVVPVLEMAEADAAEETRPNPTVITPAYHAEGGLSIDAAQPSGHGPQGGPAGFGSGPFAGAPGTGRRPGGRRRPLMLIGGGLLATVLVGIGAFAIATSGSDSARTTGAAATPRAPGDAAPSQQAPTTPAARPPTGPSKIDHVRTDGRPFPLTEAFPVSRITLAGRVYTRDRSSINHQCALAARGAMARALTAQSCTSVVRVTFLDSGRSLAVTTGVAVLPTKAAALRTVQAGDPSKYEWFRGMPGKRTPNIDRAGGYAASTVRGRYIAYAYATFANGQRPQANDPTLKAVAEQFVEYALRPIDARARG